MGLAWPTTRASCIGNTPQNCKIFMIFKKILLHHPKKYLKIPGIWMTSKKYLQFKILDPKKYHCPPVGLCRESPPGFGLDWTAVAEHSRG